MRYSFDFGSNGNLADAANWQPPGGPPGAGDTALFLSTSFVDATLYGSLSTGALEFIGYNDSILLNGATLQATMPLGTQVWHDDVRLTSGSLTTTLLNDSDGGHLIIANSTAETGRTVVHDPAKLSLSFVSIQQTDWTNTGDVVVADDASGPTLRGGAELDVDGSKATIGGNLIINSSNTLDAPGAAYVYFGQTTTAEVGGNVVLGAGGELDVQQSTLSVAHDLLVDKAGSGQAGLMIQGLSGIDARVDVANNAIFGAGSTLSVTSGTLSVGNDLTIRNGAHLAAPDGTIEANTISIGQMAFLGTTPTEFGETGPGTITGLNGGDTAISNLGTIDATGTIDVQGKVTGGLGTVLLGDSAATGDLNVTGNLLEQNVYFGAAGSELFAGLFALDFINGFAAGDIIASPGIHSIAFDPTSGTLSMDKGGGNVQTLHMVGDFTGQQFVLSQNEYVTLQPAAA